MKKYILVPALLAAYAIFMTLYFGLDLLRSGHTFRFFATLSAEIILIILTFFALRRKARLHKEREKEKHS